MGHDRSKIEEDYSDGKSWRELFDVVIAQANKPSFYTSEHPFRSYDIERDTLAFTAVSKFFPNEVYYHGCLKSFLQITKWKGPEILGIERTASQQETKEAYYKLALHLHPP